MKFNCAIHLFLMIFSAYTYGQIQNNGNMRIHNDVNLGVFGNFTNNGSFTNNSGTLYATGSVSQTFNGTNLINVNNLTIVKASNSLFIDNIIQIVNELTFNNGLINTNIVNNNSKYVEFMPGATYQNASNVSHINGAVKKNGNTQFDFPIGNNTLLRPIKISAPSLITDHFTGYYVDNDPNAQYDRSSLGIPIDHVSACEYWMLNRTGGLSDVEVTLSWNTNSCGVTNLCDLVVAQWEDTIWNSKGNGGVAGNFISGNVVSGNNCANAIAVSSFGAFTLGSISSSNPLPIELLSFDAVACQDEVCLSWETASEVNNDFFTVEKSQLGYEWESVVKIDGAGNSQEIIKYSTQDNFPYSRHSYYRLKQTDYDGQVSYSDIRTVHFDNGQQNKLSIFPNPSLNEIFIRGLKSDISDLKIYNSMNQDVTSSTSIIDSSISNLKMDISALSNGIYFIKTMSDFGLIIKQ